MYVLSIRLYDLGLKDEAVYWFYSAQWRGRVFSGLLDPEVVGTIGSPGFERIHAYGAFQQLAGTYINGYAFGDIPKLLKTLAVVREENERLPDYQAMHPHLKFIPDGAWPEKNRVMAEGFDRLVRQIEETADEIKATRQRNGMEGRF